MKLTLANHASERLDGEEDADHTRVARGMPQLGCASDAAYARLCRELQGDGLPHRNLASFVTTSMDHYASLIALGGLEKNLINRTEYPQTNLIHRRVVRWVAELFHAPWAEADESEAGVTTTGSSEAVMLAMMVHRMNWSKRDRARCSERPYVIAGTLAHECFGKFAKYFEVGIKSIAPAPGHYALTAAQVEAVLQTRIADDPQVLEECGLRAEDVGDRRMSELVMAIGCVAGTTYTGHCDDIEGIDRMLGKRGWDIPIHVDAASGGFVLPFLEPALQWDFRLRHVQSINVSNHKYGLVYCGLATLVFRSAEVVNAGAWVHSHYLSGRSRTLGLSFSRASHGVLVQYYNFLSLGYDGYARVIGRCLAIAQHISETLKQLHHPTPCFQVLSNTRQLPVVTFRLTEHAGRLTLASLALQLKLNGWIVPVFPLPSSQGPIEVIRVVVRAEFSHDDASAFLRDVSRAVQVMVE